ncbi:MAG TPA: elongation factor G, partial [Nitrospira sp.]
VRCQVIPLPEGAFVLRTTEEDPMHKPDARSLRNVAIIGSRGAGKTSLAEAMSFTAGAMRTLGSVPEGTTLSDFEPEEIKHGSSVSTSLLRCGWNHCTINLLDTPGALSLIGEPVAALQAADAVILVVNPSSGIRGDLAKFYSYVKARHLPCLMFVNEQEKGTASIEDLLVACRRDLDVTALPVSCRMEEGSDDQGVIDLLKQTVVHSSCDQAKWEEQPVLPDAETMLADARKRVLETAAEADDETLERYLSAGELSPTELMQGLRHRVQAEEIVPVLVGSATKNRGVVPLLNAIVDLLPSPADRDNHLIPQGVHPTTKAEVKRPADSSQPFSGLVFKTVIDPFVGRLSFVRVFSGSLHADHPVFNASRQIKEKGGHLFTLLGKQHTTVTSAEAGDIVAVGKLKDAQTGDTLCDEQHPICYPWPKLPRPVISFAIEPKSTVESDKVSLGLHKLMEEDPTLEFTRNAETKEMVLSAIGQWHLDMALEKLCRKYGAEVLVHRPKIPYHETIQVSARAQGKYKKQTGGHGQYGDCWLELAPAARGEGFLFENRVVGGVIPRNFIPAIEKGVTEAMQHGTLAGYPVVDVRVAVYDGSYHTVDSSDMSFKIAGSMAFKQAMESAHPILLEPMMTVEVEASVDHIGAVIGDLNARRGRILQVEGKGRADVVTALVPLAEMTTYATSLNGLTGGAGSFSMEFGRYDEVPRDQAGKIIEEARTTKPHALAH